jgi:hypothetical protein
MLEKVSDDESNTQQKLNYFALRSNESMNNESKGIDGSTIVNSGSTEVSRAD